MGDIFRIMIHLEVGRRQDGGNHIPDIQCSESQGSNLGMLMH